MTPDAHPSRSHFDELARSHTLVPVYRTLTADLETPVSAFLRLARDEPEAFLLESVEGGERVGRYTFMGIEPYRRILARGAHLTVSEGDSHRHFEGNLFAELKQTLSGHTPARLPGLPPFTAGAVGFFAYDVVRQIERLPSLAADELGVPDACLLFFDQVVAFDHVKKEIHLIVTADLTRQLPADAYDLALHRLAHLEARLSRALPSPPVPVERGQLELTPRTSRSAFLHAVDRTKEYIASGDVFQCVLSQRFDCTPGVDAFAIYRALRIVNPSPYMYFLRFPLDGRTGHIVGSSPELLVRVHGRRIEYRPIAGTRRRGEDEAEDRALEADLRADEKEVAEHIMLVDLGRNDVGRVSDFGSVQVTDLMSVERYSHVMHLVSSIEGRMKPELSALDAFKACFPAGTLSGAPKIRAMEIIEEMEPARRGVYGGSILYADFSGNLDSCIAIRTLFMDGDRGHIQAGAGIVADSIAESEYAECSNKAQAVVRAIERARQG
jgi:anthranilate synthase component 1